MEHSTPEQEPEKRYSEYHLEWRGTCLLVRHCPDWFSLDSGFVTHHIEIRSEGRMPFPISKTGYRSQFLNGADALTEFDNDPLTFVIWWLEEAAKSKEWQEQQQLDLF